ncbi:MAG: heme exporter protein CcmB [Chloroflexota bacterium]|nr:heme exporter protein CcmB [Chloroflexota bacterium]
MREFVSKVSVIVWKDILSQLRSKDVFTSVLVFALLTIIIFNFAFDLDAESTRTVAPGILWVAFTFAGVLNLNRTFVQEKENGCLDGLLLCPVDRTVIYVGKMVGSFLFMLVVEIIILPIFSILYDFDLFVPKLIVVTVLATLGFAAIGTIFSAMSANTKARDIMLPILFFPMVTPIIIAAVEASALALENAPWADFSTWLQILIAFDVVFLIVSSLIFEFITEE